MVVKIKDDVSILEDVMIENTWYTLNELCNLVFETRTKSTYEQRSRITKKLGRLRNRGYVERNFECKTKITFRLKPTKPN